MAEKRHKSLNNSDGFAFYPSLLFAKTIVFYDCDNESKHSRSTRRVGNLMPAGDCYPAALNLLGECARSDDGAVWTLVHGIVTGRGSIEGKRFTHAWVERLDQAAKDQASEAVWSDLPDAAFTTVYDYSNDRQAELAAILYYKIGDVQVVARYTADEALEAAMESEHYGPWDSVSLAMGDGSDADSALSG